jgi:hypothetical protein
MDVHIDDPGMNFKTLASDIRANPASASADRSSAPTRCSVGAFVGEIYCNAKVTLRLIRKYCVVDAASKSLLENSITRLGCRPAPTAES